MTAIHRLPACLTLCLTLAACGGVGSLGGSSPLGSLGISAGGGSRAATATPARVQGAETVAVNRYLWFATLDVLAFLPLESADPFTGVMVFGFGTPPGGGTAYRATVYVSDPSLDARALNVALATRGGAVSPDTNRAIEDAILSRARQLRIADNAL